MLAIKYTLVIPPDFQPVINAFQQGVSEGLEEIGEEIKERFSEVFATEGHGSWQPLAPSTIERREFPGLPILVQTGRLLNAFTDGAQVKTTSNSIEVGSNDKIGRFHQFGTSRMPARPIVITKSEDLEGFQKIIEDKIRSHL